MANYSTVKQTTKTLTKNMYSLFNSQLLLRPFVFTHLIHSDQDWPTYGKVPRSLGRGGGLVVSVLAFYFDNPSSNPAGCLNFQYEKTKINEKRPGLHVHRAKAYGCQLDASIGTPA